MQRSEALRDVAAILLMLPFAIPAIYAIFLWFTNGISPVLPDYVYLQVTRDPYVYLAGVFSICMYCFIEIVSTSKEQRRGRISELSTNVQKVSLASTLLAFLIALYSSGFNPGNAVLDFLFGKYNIIFPATLLLFSFLLVIPIRKEWVRSRYALSVFLLIITPLIIYEGGKRIPSVAFPLSLLIILVSIYLFFSAKR